MNDEKNVKNMNNNNNNEDIKGILSNKKAYFFSQEDLENYYKIFISLEDYLNSLTKKNALNDIISYGDLRYTYKIGFEHIILLLKSYPFNLLRLIYQRQYYKDVLRQFFIPYLRRAFNNISLYTYYKLKFSEVNKVLEQIYRIVFLKRLNFYGQIMQLLKKESESQNNNENKGNNNINNDTKRSSTNKNINNIKKCSKSGSFQKIENVYSLDEKTNKKAQILYKKRKIEQINSQDKTSGIIKFF